MIDESLDRAGQTPLSADDFEQLPNREVFRAFRSAIDSSAGGGLDLVRSKLEAALQAHLNLLLDTLVERPTVGRGSSDEQDAVQAGLRLRERRLRREGRELHGLLQEAQNDPAFSDLAALQQSSQANAMALLRLQQILSARTITRASTVEPWGRN